jgi:outer membrane protein TolC
MKKAQAIVSLPAASGALLLFVTCALLAGCVIAPRPLELPARQAALPGERAALFADQEPVTQPISLDEAIARAIKYNLDYREKLMEQALAQNQLDLSRIDLLPRLVAAAGYTDRNRELASSSRDIYTGAQSLVPSTSTDKQYRTADLALSWNVLDFGVSYYRARQQADRVLIAQEQRRKTIHLVMQQIRQSYWQAAGAQLLEHKIDPILGRAQQALEDSHRIENERLLSPLEALNYQRQLLDIIRQLESLNDELSQAKPRLAALMNLEPGKDFRLDVPEELAKPTLRMSVDKMEETALLRRPELMQARYNERIGVLETREAIARLLPGIEFSAGTHYDSNSFLINNTWSDLGIRASWNLFNLLSAKAIRRTAAAQLEIAREQKLALSMAILAQTQVSYRDYLGCRRQYELSSEIDDVEKRILGHTHNAAQNDAQGKLQEIRASASALMSELRLYQTYGALQGAYGQMLSSLGLDPLPDTVPARDLGTLKHAVHDMEDRWARELGVPSNGS